MDKVKTGDVMLAYRKTYTDTCPQISLERLFSNSSAESDNERETFEYKIASAKHNNMCKQAYFMVRHKSTF